MSKKIENALNFIADCLSDYCENSLESDRQEQRKVDKAFQLIKATIQNLESK